MRLIGTGKDPENRYPEGLVFDAPPHVARQVVDAGYATVQDPEDDTARTKSQMAAAVARGDTLNDPVDQKLAGQFAGAGENPAEGEHPLNVVQGGDVSEPTPGGAPLGAPLGVGPEQLPESATSGVATAGPAAPAAPAEGSPQAEEAAATAEAGESSAEEAGEGDEEELTHKEQLVERAKELGVPHSGTVAELEERIAEAEAQGEQEA